MTGKKALTFIHTADWHTGYAFPNFDREMRNELKRAIFRTVEMVYRYARKMEIPFVLCAGNMVADGRLCPKEDLLKLFKIIEKYPAIRTLAVTGSGNPHGDRSVYTLIGKEKYPENFYLATSDEEFDFPEWNMKIYAVSTGGQESGRHPLDWLDAQTLDKEKINIGLCHGNSGQVRDHEDSADDSPAPGFTVPAGFAEKHGFDYLTLGGRRTYEKIDERSYYPGAPEPLQFGEEGFPLKVEIAGPGSIPRVEPVKHVNQYRWLRLSETLTAATFEAFKLRLQSGGEKEIRELTVSGSLPLETYKEYRELLEMNRHRFVDIHDRVSVQAGEPTFGEPVDGYMAEVARRLMELKESGAALPEGIVNPYVSVERDEVHRQAEELERNSETVIDRALLNIYRYIKENAQ